MTNSSNRRMPGGATVPLLAAGTFFGHAIWPTTALVLARVLGERNPLPAPPADDTSRFVSVVVPAYREVTTIGHLLKILLHSEGTPVDEVVVVADDDEETAAVARDGGATVVTGKGRGGKSGALNRGVARARNEVVVMLDANAIVTTDDVRKLAEHVRSGRLDLAGGVRTEEGSAGEGLYWRFENTTKKAEHALGGCLLIVGEMIALRKAAYRPIPEWVKGDDFWLAVDFEARGHKVSVDTSCVATEPSARPRVQFERRIRIMAANLETMAKEPGMFAKPTVPMAILHAHKTWRSTGGPLCQMVLTALALRSARTSWVARGWLLVNGVGVGDYVFSALGNREQGRLRSLGSQALGMPPVILVAAVWRIVRKNLSGTSDGTWTKVAR